MNNMVDPKDLDTDDIMERIFNYQKFRLAYELGIITYKEFLEKAKPLFEK